MFDAVAPDASLGGMEQDGWFRASDKALSLSATTRSDGGMPVFSTLGAEGSKTDLGADPKILAGQRWHRAYIAFFCNSVPVYIIASPTGTLHVRCCAAEAKRGKETGEVEEERWRRFSSKMA